MRILALIPLLLAGYVAQAGAQAPPALSFPVDCRIGDACWILSHVDTQPGPGYVDYHGGYRTYEDHKGTDIALVDPDDIAEDVPVRAAASGVVLGMRDGMPDNPPGTPTYPKGKECGNGARIDHGGGWTTQYCHLKQGSIQVKTGDRVDAGTPIGALGGSGASETPHLHLQLEYNRKTVDPFTGRVPGGDPIAHGPLWTPEALRYFGEYRSSFLHQVGFASGRITLEGARGEPPAHLPVTSPALVVYATVYGIGEGDTIEIEIFDPHGEQMLDFSESVKKPWARYFKVAGRRAPPGGWPRGVYRGRVGVSGKALGETRVELR